jgi:hypothetical protein
MTKDNQSFSITQGQTLQVTVNVDASGSTTAATLTGATLGFWLDTDINIAASSDADLIYPSSDMSLVNVDGTNDGIRFTILDSDSAALSPGSYFFEVWAKDTSSNVAPVATGFANVKPAIGSL